MSTSRRTLKPLIAAILIAVLLVFLTHRAGSLEGLGGGWGHATHSERSLIPEKIWYKLGPKGLNDNSRNWTGTCLENNPTYRSEFLTDASGDLYVQKNFAHMPHIVETYLALNIPILKADILRYLILYHDGGIWSDLDVSCADIPIRNWIPQQYRKDAALVVGWEFDIGWKEPYIRQFASWWVMAKPGSPHLKMVIDDIIEDIRSLLTTKNIPLASLSYENIEVVDLTGPRRLTKSIVKSLGIDKKNITGIYEPKLVGDVLVLPGFAFALSANHYAASDVLGPTLIMHHYAGSWKNPSGGEL